MGLHGLNKFKFYCFVLSSLIILRSSCLPGATFYVFFYRKWRKNLFNQEFCNSVLAMCHRVTCTHRPGIILYCTVTVTCMFHIFVDCSQTLVIPRAEEFCCTFAICQFIVTHNMLNYQLIYWVERRFSAVSPARAVPLPGAIDHLQSGEVSQTDWLTRKFYSRLKKITMQERSSFVTRSRLGLEFAAALPESLSFVVSWSCLWLSGALHIHLCLSSTNPNLSRDQSTLPLGVQIQQRWHDTGAACPWTSGSGSSDDGGDRWSQGESDCPSQLSVHSAQY